MRAERQRELDAEHVLPQRRHQPLDHALDVVLDDEGHLEVDLRELGLAVEAQVLVAEAAHDLEVAVEARDHEQLLEELRRLGERVELPGLSRDGTRKLRAPPGVYFTMNGVSSSRKPRSCQVAARASALICERIEEVLLQRRAAQVEVAVLEAHVSLVSMSSSISNGGVSEREKIVERVGLDLDLAGRELGVHVPPRATTSPADADAALAAQLAGQRVGVLVDARLEHDLGEAVAVAQIDEHAAAVVAVATCTQPNRTTCLPASPARSAPQPWVRFRSVRNSGMVATLSLRSTLHAGSLERNALARPLPRQLLRRLQLRRRVLSFLSRTHRQGAGRHRLPAAGAQGRRASVLGGLLRRRRERLRRLSLLAGPAPDLVVRSPRVGVPAPGRRGSFRADATGASSTIPSAKSCTKFLAGVVAAKFGFDAAPLAELHRVGGDHRRRAVHRRQDGGRAEASRRCS